jgi:NitT/TauT family transport system substrate-binding protein
MKKYLLPLGFIVLAVLLVYGTFNYYTVTSDTIVVGYLPSSHHSALFVADALQMYEKEGLKVQMVPFRTGSEMMDAANKNQIDIGLCGIPPVTRAIDENSTVKIVAPVNEDGSGIVVTKDSGISNASDLEGKRILEPSEYSIQDLLFRYMLMENNVSSSSIIISQMDVPLMQGVINSGKADGFVAWEPYVTQANQSGNDTVLESSSDIWKDHPCCVVVATNNMITKKPDQLRKFLKVHVESTDYVNAHLNETALIVSKKLGTNANIELNSLEHVKFIGLPSDNFDNNLMKMVSIEHELGYVNNNLTLNQIVNYDFLP